MSAFFLEIQGHPGPICNAPAPMAGWHGITVLSFTQGRATRLFFPIGDEFGPASHFQPEGRVWSERADRSAIVPVAGSGWSGRPWYTSVITSFTSEPSP